MPSPVSSLRNWDDTELLTISFPMGASVRNAWDVIRVEGGGDALRFVDASLWAEGWRGEEVGTGEVSPVHGTRDTPEESARGGKWWWHCTAGT